MAAFISLTTRSGLAGVTNGDFTYGLDAWTIESGAIEEWSGEAKFAPDDPYEASILRQIFMLDAGSMTLYFRCAAGN
jgi:hypothetical protein